MSEEDGMQALKELGNPDLSSRSREFDGRRMVRVNGGFVILNYMKYRDRDNSAAERQKRYRERQKKLESDKRVTRNVDNVTRNPLLEEVEVDVKSSEKEKTLPPSSKSASPVPPVPIPSTPEERPSLETVVNPTGADVAAVPRETSKSVVRGKRFDPKGGLPEEWRLWCRQHRPDLAPQATFDSFSDFWVARAGAAGVKVDWFATWRNWCRKEKPGGSVVGAGGVSRQAQLEARNAAAMLEFVGGAK